MQKQPTAMQRGSIILLFYLFGQVSAICQTISGEITDENNNQLPYVNIGVLNQNKGTISNISGKFLFNISDIDNSEIIRFSSVGYESVDFQVSDLKIESEKNFNIVLKKVMYQIDELSVKSNERKIFCIGSKNAGSTTWAWYNLMNGAEIGRLFHNKEMIYLRHFYFHIGETNCDSILYRLKIYQTTDQLPDSIINKEEIFYTSKTKKGWECISLIDHSVLFDSDFIITLETINGWNSGGDKSVYLSKTQHKGLSYKRRSSMASWLRFEGEMSYKLEVSK